MCLISCRIVQNCNWVIICLGLSLVINIGSAKAEGEGAVQNQSKPKVAIIIDDFGNGQNGTEEIFNMPIKLTIAIMPFLPTSRRDAELAHQKGFDVIVHMPMQPKHGKASWLGPGAITSELSDTEVRKRVNAAIDDIPYAIGMNNHMGSLITGDERIMSVVMQVCLERGLFYVDSSTNYRSIVGKLARQMGMPPVVNHLFLDDIHTNSHINKQLQAVESWGKEHQYCVTIGHVSSNGDITAKVLRTRIPQMKNNVEFVGISDLVKEVWGWGPSSIAPLNN